MTGHFFPSRLVVNPSGVPLFLSSFLSPEIHRHQDTGVSLKVMVSIYSTGNSAKREENDLLTPMHMPAHKGVGGWADFGICFQA